MPEATKQRRLNELIAVFHEHARSSNARRHGSIETVLVESTSKRSQEEVVGRSDGNLKVIVPKTFVDKTTSQQVTLQAGDYVVVRVPTLNLRTVFVSVCE